MTVGTSARSILMLCLEYLVFQNCGDCIDCLALFHVASLSRSMHPTSCGQCPSSSWTVMLPSDVHKMHWRQRIYQRTTLAMTRICSVDGK